MISIWPKKLIKFLFISLMVLILNFMCPLSCFSESTYPSPEIDSAGVVAMQNPDGSSRTVFYAYISGPSPLDINSFNVNGPSDSYKLTPSLETHQDGLCFLNGTSEIVPNGDYVFEIVDSQGRKDSIKKGFTYKSDLEGIDSSSMQPYGYVNTTTPTLSFEPVSNSNVYYMLYVINWPGSAFAYRSDITQNPSFTIPKGMLQPESPYFWFIRVFDKKDPENGVQSEAKILFTGKKGSPDLSFREVMSISSKVLPVDRQGKLFSVKQPHLAPWDIEYIRVHGPEQNATTYDYFDHNIECAFDETARYNYISLVQSMPDGTYTFEVKDKSGKHISETLDFAQKNLPAIDETSIQPKNNSYFPTSRPSFSWDPVQGDDEYYYVIEIRDFTRKVQWFQSEAITRTSFTLPKDVQLPSGNSYQWRVMVTDSNSPLTLNNINFSSWRIFTINKNKASITSYLQLLLQE